MRWNALATLVFSRKARLTSPDFRSSCSRLTLLPEWVTSHGVLAAQLPWRAHPADLTTGAQAVSPPSPGGPARRPSRTAARPAPESRAYWRWRCCPQPPSGARPASCCVARQCRKFACKPQRCSESRLEQFSRRTILSEACARLGRWAGRKIWPAGCLTRTQTPWCGRNNIVRRPERSGRGRCPRRARRPLPRLRCDGHARRRLA